MRLSLKLSPIPHSIPFDYLHQMTGTLHKWLGPNNVHDAMSMYSFGWLKGGHVNNKKLYFSRGATWQISFYEKEHARCLINGAMQDPEAFYGMRVLEIQEQPSPALNGQHRFKTDGGHIVVRKKRADGSRAYLFWDDDAANHALTGLLRRKMEIAGFSGPDLDVQVSFDRSYPHPRTKLSTIKRVKHKGSECPVIIKGTRDAMHFAWLVGVGELTGSGLGGLQ